MKLIDKAAVVAEIAKRVKESEIVLRDCPSSAIFGLAQAYKNVLSFLDTLEVKDVDEIIKNAEDHAYLAGQEKIIDKAIKWLEDNIDRYLYNTGGYEEYIPKCGGKMFEDFKKAMEE